MKQLLLRSVLGRYALAARDRVRLLRSALANPEAVGALANDQLATTLITGLCRSRETFVDVGAHIGSVSTEVMRRDPTIRVVAIEPVPEKAARLRRRFPRLEVFACAAGETEGEAPFYVHRIHSGYSSLVPPREAPEHTREIRTTVRRLDDLLPERGIGAIKVDVEGAELGVLRGAPDILADCRPVIGFESTPFRDADEEAARKAIWDLLRACDFTVHVPNRVAHEDDGLTREGFRESHLYPRRTTDYLALPRERRAEIRDRARAILNGRGARRASS